MRGITFAQHVNARNRHDATGAFIPGAQQFTRKHSLDPPIWLNDRNDRSVMIDGIASSRDLDVIAYFGHGLRSGLPSADIWWKDLGPLANSIRIAAAPGCRVILYACTAGQEGCFANQLSKLLNFRFTIWGHTCAGHSFTNPYVTRYPHGPDPTPYLVDPHGPLWAKWYRLIKGKSDIWTRYPFLSKQAVETEIETGEIQVIDSPRRMLIDL